jgi:hypothetical protein
MTLLCFCKIVTTKPYGKDKKLVLGEVKINLADFVLNPSFYTKIPITNTIDPQVITTFNVVKDKRFFFFFFY